MGIEAAARRARYDFLARVARQEDCQCVVLGHHADDQAETILLNIIRGSGLRGLGGMRLVSPLPGHPQLKLVRPLLTINRAELEQYCKANRLRYRQDETNWDTRYRRNFLRHEVMAKLTRLNPAAASALSRLAESAAIDERFLASHVDAVAGAAVRNWGDGCSISRPLFMAAHPALQRRLLRRVFEQLVEAGASLTHELSLDLVDFCLTARSGARRDLGAGLELRIDYDSIGIQPRGAKEPPGHYRLIPVDTDIAIRAEAGYEIGGLSIHIGTKDGDCQTGAALVLPAGCQLRLRTRRAGDRFRPKGMRGRRRKLKDWMIDRKIPRRLRDQIPLLCADDAIVAICIGPAWQLAELDDSQADARSGTVVCLE